MEKKSLSILTKEPGITEEFNELVLRFTDGTYEEIKKLAGGAPASPRRTPPVCSATTRTRCVRGCIGIFPRASCRTC